MTACPECLLANNRLYLKRLQNTIWISIAVAVIGAIIGIGAMGGSGIIAGPFYALGLYWGWNFIVKSFGAAAYAGLLGGAIPFFLVLMFGISFGWIIGFFVGLWRFAGVVREYTTARQTADETERFVAGTIS